MRICNADAVDTSEWNGKLLTTEVGENKHAHGFDKFCLATRIDGVGGCHLQARTFSEKRSMRNLTFDCRASCVVRCATCFEYDGLFSINCTNCGCIVVTTRRIAFAIVGVKAFLIANRFTSHRNTHLRFGSAMPRIRADDVPQCVECFSLSSRYKVQQ